MTDELERKALMGIAGATMASGAAQILAPGAMLGSLGVEDSPATRQLFGTVGLFMAIVGGLLFGAVRGPRQGRQVVLWASAQKLGAASAVAIGVRRSVFSPVVLFVASFDFASGLLGLDYWRRLSSCS